ncbi:MAG: hypothetical protein EBV74_06100 [Alphaproteobacteria bacterium]|nr:hypothetical protein [Candidatus Fonsibacter sp. PEL55]
MNLIKMLKNFFLSLIVFSNFTLILNAQTRDALIPNNLNIFGGTAYNNFEVASGIGLSTNYNSFQHITQPTGDQQKFDSFGPALEANIYYKNKSENILGFGFLVNGFKGTNKESFNYSTTVGSHGSDAGDINSTGTEFLDVMPITGVASIGATQSNTTSSFKIKSDLNSYSISPYVRLDSNFFNSPEFKFLKNYTTDVGIIYNSLNFDLSVDLFDTSGSRTYFLNEKVKHNSIGPFISLTNTVPVENSSYQIIYGAKLAALFTESKLTANQSNTNNVQTYNVSDKNNHLGGLGTISLGIINPLPQGMFYFMVNGTIRNDVSKIVNPRCGANIDCNAASDGAVNVAGYAAYGTRSPAHLERTTNVSGSLMAGVKLDF